MKNIIYPVNQQGLPLIPAAPVPAATVTNTKMGIGRLLQLYLRALLTAILTAIIAIGISGLTDRLMRFAFYGQWETGAESPAYHNLGAAVILLPVAGSLLLLWAAVRNSNWLKIPGMILATATGGSLGKEAPAMLMGGMFGILSGKKDHFLETEQYTLFVAGACSGLAMLFGAPVAALLLALEIWLPQWKWQQVLPAVIGAAVGGAGNYVIHHGNPVFHFGDGPAFNLPALGVYFFIGLLAGLLAGGITRLYHVIQRLTAGSSSRNKGWILAAALLTGLIGYLAPETLGAGDDYISNLLRARVTLQLLFVWSVLKLVAWLFFAGVAKTGSSITPVLITGGAVGLLLAVVIQLIFPAIIINPVMAALIGMFALFAGTSRALLAAIALGLETTHQWQASLPLVVACVAAYSLAVLVGRKRNVEAVR
ncbi:chloride channel protein [Chitinophaga nivalis]|uniref:Chloride channel protein n=1 Tax=Chitinophaga nivalis TaxID=2991709 RepID=A0ABT3IUJ4_9BACT|nr:chloride channel protein [Chitinophaga nivalis]MCW3462661.1 chloride channel protein [Chitinophaga nivalis]MCW3487648.1 chloride channel protein [Chitinophaga nivalis]